jgi:hypothetical protein
MADLPFDDATLDRLAEGVATTPARADRPDP